jgi:nucleotide-binding universal stress UspA family protein
MSKRMLFGDDGSSHADSAWLWINSHQWPGWTIDVLTALDNPEKHAPAPRTLLRPDVADGVHAEVAHEDPRYALHTRAGEHDLVVIGTRGHGLLKAMHLGSTAEWLMHAPPSPLVLVKSGHRTQKILLAHDGSPHAQAVEEAIISLPWAHETAVMVVSVEDHGTDPQSTLTAAVDRLSGHVGEVSGHELKPDELTVFFRPRDLILDAATAWEADMIALGSRGLTAWESLNEVGLHRAGSTATAITDHAPCTVLLARAEH